MEALIIFLAAAALSVAGHHTGMRGIRRGNARMRDIGLMTAIICAAAAVAVGTLLLHRLMNWMGL